MSIIDKWMEKLCFVADESVNSFNFRSLEQSNSWLEQRNDDYKSTASQIQGHVLTLEQDKVSLFVFGDTFSFM